MHDYSYRTFAGVSRTLLLIAVLITTSVTAMVAQNPGWPAANEEAQKDTLVLTSHPISSPGLHTQLHVRSLGAAATDTIGRYLGIHHHFQYLPASQRFFKMEGFSGFYFIDRNLENKSPVEFANTPGGMSYFNGTRIMVADEQGEHFFYYQRNVPLGIDGLYYIGINDSVNTQIHTRFEEPSEMILDHDNLVLYVRYGNNNGDIIRYSHATGVTDTLTVAPQRVSGMDINTANGDVFYYNNGRIFRSNVSDLTQREFILQGSSFSQAGEFTITKMHYDQNRNRLFVAFRGLEHLNELFEISLGETPQVTTHTLPNHGYIQSMAYFGDTNTLISLGAGLMNFSNGNTLLEYSFDSGETHVPGSHKTEAMVFDRETGYLYQLELTFNNTAYLITRMYPDGSGRELVAWMPMNSQANRFVNTIRIDETGRRLLYLWINGAGNEYIGSINLDDISDRTVVHEFTTDGPRVIASFDYDEVNNTYFYMHIQDGFYKCDVAFDSCNLHWARGNDTYARSEDLNAAFRDVQMKVVPESNHLFFNVADVGIRYVNLDNAQEAALIRATPQTAILRNLQYNPDLQWLTMYEQVGFQRSLWGFSLPNAEVTVNERIDSGNVLESALVVVFDPSVVVSIDDEPLLAMPNELELGQNYPNPFNPTTRIPFTLQESAEVTLEVYDVTGRKVATLVNGILPAGVHTASFDGAGLSSGLYLYRLTAGARVESRAMTLIK